MKKLAVQHKKNGQLVFYADTVEEIKVDLELFDIVPTNLSYIKVTYTELSGPQGYGHQEPAFTTYGSIIRCLINLGKWMQETAVVFGPDPRDIRDYFKHCSIMCNDKDMTSWLLKVIETIPMKNTLYT